MYVDGKNGVRCCTFCVFITKNPVAREINMIIDFTVENFRSIKKAQTLSMLATKLKEHPQNIAKIDQSDRLNILKSCVIYGANASGKSNVLKSLVEFRNIILHSTELKLKQRIPAYEPFRLDKSCTVAPTKFEMEFIPYGDGIRYRYLVEFTEFHIEREELFFYPKKQEAILFSRVKGSPIKFGNYLTGKKKNIEGELLGNNLFLSKAANSNHEQLKGVYLYFLTEFEIMMKDSFGEFVSKNHTSRAIHSNECEALRDKVKRFLMSVDTGISSLEVIKRELDDEVKGMISSDLPLIIKEAMEDNFIYRTQVGHKLYENDEEAGEVQFDLREESDGTVKLYSLACDLIEVLLEGKILIIDELDNSLHPHITSLIFNLFNDPKINKKNAQLITATHDSSLLNPDFVRRDQVWFTKKIFNNSTELYSLVEFDKNEVRSKTQFNDWYLAGRFDAVPIIDKSIYEIFETN